VVLPRRTNTLPGQTKCRNKGKAVIVRIGSISSPASLTAVAPGRLALWLRKLVSVIALCASVVALALIVDTQNGQLSGAGLENASDTLSLAAPPAQQDSRDLLAPAEESRYRALSEFVANRYRVSQDVAFDLVSLAHRVGEHHQLDPLLIIAVIAIESRFNPIAESVAGAKGLMQIIPKYHTDKLEAFGGERAVFDPATNIRVGAQILKEYIRITGNLGIALQMYAGALSDTEDQYTHKVLSEKQRLQHVVTQSVRRSAPAAAPIRTAAARNNKAFTLPLD
jgi:soluble lytic murein transglycosylase-like protein